VFALLGLLLVQGLSTDSMAARAESSLAAGDVRTALQIATKIVERRPRDAAAHMLLGRVHYARPIIGRFPALEEFRTAARLAPSDPESFYWQMKAGFYLRSDDGDYIARLGLLGLFAVTPDYADAWQRFREIYQGPSVWRQAERAFARHGENPVALERRAELLIALEDGKRADSLLAIVAARRGSTVQTYLLRSEAAFLTGQTPAGLAWHDSAVAGANIDSIDALWSEAVFIASPTEVARHETLDPGERRAFYRHFWQQRDPDLLSADNERLPEHYARRAELRRTYRLLHPQRSVYHSKWARTLKYYDDRQNGHEKQPVAITPIPSLVEALQDTALPLAFRAGVTAQGLVYLRYGAPDRRLNCGGDVLRPTITDNDLGRGPGCSSFLDGESWAYWTPHGPVSINFEDEYFKPVSRNQLATADFLLHSDRSALPAPLVVRAWVAFFKSSEVGLTDAYYKARGDSAAVVLWDETGVTQRASGSGLLRLTAAPGRYDLGLDVDSAGVLGRFRRPAAVPGFSLLRLSLSSLVLMPFERGARLPDRETALRGMPADLAFRAGTPLAAYVEIYGLQADQDGRSHYRVRYTFEPVRSAVAKFLLGTPRPVVFEFDRTASGASANEQLTIEPDKLPAGRYRVSVAMTDLSGNVKSQSVAILIAIR
jgi:hypothetical protein